MNFGRRECIHRCPSMRWYKTVTVQGSSAGREIGRRGVESRPKPSCKAGACRPSTLSDKRSGAIARRAAILLSGTAAVALSIAQPASAISINDQAAAAAGGIANYYDAGNQFPNVVSLVDAAGSFCTGSLINSRTILTAAHCFAPNQTISISFSPIAGPGT